MNVKEYVRSNRANSNGAMDSVYSLLTNLSRHTLQIYRAFHRNVQITYEDDIKAIKHLRTKAFEILLKKCNGSAPSKDYKEYPEADPFLEIQKYAFALRLGLKHFHDAITLEDLLETLDQLSRDKSSISSVLQLLIALKSFNLNPAPITNIFYCGKNNPSLPEIIYNLDDVPPFQTYPMECFFSSDKFEAALETERFQIRRTIPVNVMNELNCLHDAVKSEAVMGTENMDTSVTCNFMSNHMFDKTSSYTLGPSQWFAINSEFNLFVGQNSAIGDRWENLDMFCLEREISVNCLSFPFVNVNNKGNGETADTWRPFSDQCVTDQSNDIENVWDYGWNQVDIIDAMSVSDLNRQTWEYFGEIEFRKESMFITDTSIAAIYLEKIQQMNDLCLLSEKIMNSVFLLQEVSTKDFISDVKSMLLGIESNSFEYKYATGFVLRKNVSVYGVCSKSLEKTCQEAIHWGNSFRFLSDLVVPRSQDNKLPQEGLIFKAMCTNIKELLLYYQAVLLRIFTGESESGRLLAVLEKVRSAAALIKKVATVCEPYKENQNNVREGSSILTRIYSEAVKVTDTKIALVFYSLLKSCCDVYFRFLQKWIFEGVCDDVYGEFMIKTRPQYLRNRSHKFWTKSFSICNDAVPSFLNDLAESILQCGKTVRLLRTCDSKNPVCHVCVTEQPEIKVCLSVTGLREQSSKCREYEEKGKSALGSVVSLSTAISNRKQLERQMSEIVVRSERDALSRIHEEKGGGGGKVNREEEKEGKGTLVRDLQQMKEKESESSNRTLPRIEHCTDEGMTEEETRRVERSNILNYYEKLTYDINKRCIRSQWRVKRMKLYDKRVDALHATKQDSSIKLKATTEPNYVVTTSSLVETPISFEDENSNFAETSFRIFDSEAILMKNRRSLTDRVHETTDNNNGENGFKNFTGTGVETETEIGRERETLNAQGFSTIERPTFLNVTKTVPIRSNAYEVDRMRDESLECVMTPNNNELDIRQLIEIGNETTRRIGRCNVSITGLNEENELETPVSCVTDNLTGSSMQSLISQAYNLENSSFIDSSSLVAPSNCTRPISKSSLAVKKDSTFSDLFELAHDVSPVADSLNITDVEIIDHISLQAYLEKSIRIPLNVQSRLVNNSIIKYFLKENNLLLHLHSLRSYFFLLNGEFAKVLTDSLYARLYEISIPIELFNSATLTNLLERALVNSFNSVYVNSELVSLSATDTPTQLHISDPAALDCLSLNYKISWPLNIILDETIMQQYGKVFRFLITSGRVSWVLQEDFNIMKRERKAVTSEQYHKLQLYRHSMTQFMNALHNYLTCSVLHASWTEFEKDLEHSLTVDQIYLSHVNYIKRILSRCMLNSRGEKVRVCLNNIFKVILKFHNRIRCQNWVMKPTGNVHPNFKKLEQMYKAFCELRAYMAHVALKLATSGYQPHLMHFLNALNMNHLYDLTVKT